MCIDTTVMNVEINMPIWHIISNLWTFSVWYMCDFLSQTCLSFIWTWIYLNWNLCYIDLACYQDTYFIYFPNTKWAQIHMNLFLKFSIENQINYFVNTSNLFPFVPYQFDFEVQQIMWKFGPFFPCVCLPLLPLLGTVYPNYSLIQW